MIVKELMQILENVNPQADVQIVFVSQEATGTVTLEDQNVFGYAERVGDRVIFLITNQQIDEK